MSYFRSKLNGYKTKLILYVSTASLAALLADLQHLKCALKGPEEVGFVYIAIIVINFLLQGLIAWRAYIDDSSENPQEEKDTQTLND
jgi:hypothetical protein